MGLLDYYEKQGNGELHEEVGEFSVTGFEMAPFETNTLGVEIPVNSNLYKKIKEKDAEAKFVVVEVESGVSKSKRRWHADQLKKIETFVNNRNPVAYKGHIPAEDDATAFPEIHAVWLGAKTVESGGKCKLYLKGYLKTPEIRDEIDLEMVDAVSPRGDIKMRRGADGVLDVVDFECESIDFTRKSRNGLSSRVVTVGGEQASREGGNTVDGKDIALISESELRQFAPLLVDKIEKDAKAELESKVGEMTTAVAEAEPQLEMFKKLDDLLANAEGENVLEKVTNLLKTVEKRYEDKMRDYISEVVGKRLKGKGSELAQKLVARTVGEQIDLTGEFDDDKKKEITEAVDSAIAGDDDFKPYIVKGGEQTDDDDSDDDDDSAGGASFSKRRKQNSEGTGNGNIVTRKVKLSA